jgi:hypothetical protein
MADNGITKEDLQDALAAMEERLEQKLDTRLAATENRFREMLEGRLDVVEERLKDHTMHVVQAMETKILAEFWKWGRTSDMRTRQALAETAALSERLTAAEDRITALEHRK